MAKRKHMPTRVPLPPLNDEEKRDREYGSQNMRMLYSIWQDMKNKKIQGPANETTRQKALVELVELMHRIGGDEMMVNAYISVAPNYYIFPNDDWIVYELGFDMFFVMPVGDLSRMYESMYRDRVAGFTRMRNLSETTVNRKKMPKGFVRVPLGRVTLVDLDLKQCLGRIRAGHIYDYTCLDITFSLDNTIHEGIVAAREFLDERFEDDIGEKEENENDW